MRGILILAAAAATLGLTAAAAAAPDITLVPKSPRVGDVVFLRMQPEKGVLRVACSWAGKSYPLQANGGSYELVLPIRLGTKPGGTHATVYWKYADGSGGRETVPVEVQPRKFGVQHLKLSSDQESTYSAAATERERELIGLALDRVTAARRWHGSFIIPVEGRVSTSFGLERYVNGHFSYRHRGVDLACSEGTPVKAAAAGTVSLADDSFILHGKTIIVDHGQGVSTIYLHLSAIDVKEGDEVTAGQIIGRVGSTGVATGPHLHFAVYAYHEPVDPFFWADLPDID